MIGKKDGFQGERAVVLPPMLVEMEEQDLMCKGLFITDIGYYPKAEHHQPICAHLLRGRQRVLCRGRQTV